MSSISGFCDFTTDYSQDPEHYSQILASMNRAQAHRGPDGQGVYLAPHIGLAHSRLSVTHLDAGGEPLLKTIGGRTWAAVLDGELYNAGELKADLASRGQILQSGTDTEIILLSYLEYGREFVKRLNGVFSFAVWDPAQELLLLYRDRSGIKPLFFCKQDDRLVFASELKGILAWPGMEARLDRQGLNEIFSIGPARTCGCGILKGVSEVLPGHYLAYGRHGMDETRYWKLESHSHEDDYEKTVETAAELVLDSIRRQMVSDVPLCTFLSGGVDSSLVSAVCAAELKKKGEQLNTFSFDFTGNDRYFKANSFQPSLDRPYVDQMVQFLGSEHRYLECSIQDQADYLKQSVDAHDLPAMADVDSSMLYFCSLVKDHSKVALTGECADEIFGGYPWFHKKECFEAGTFPWTMDLGARKVLLKDEFVDYLDMDGYVAERYEASVSETPRLESDTAEEARRREIAYLNQKWFMQTLLDRMDRASMYSGLAARVPFADYRLNEYIFNVPWDMKTRGGVVKSLLRQCGKDYLPAEVLYRKKSPYPKTYDTRYEALLAEKVREILADSSSPVLPFLDLKKVDAFLNAPSDYGKPWYGQLMAGPQMLAYIWQIDYWMRKYQIRLTA